MIEVSTMDEIEINILKEFEKVKEDVKKLSPQLYYHLLELKEKGKRYNVNFSKDLSNEYFR